MEFLAQYNLTGIVIGIATFLIIGIFHPMVTKGEYYFGVKIWWLFLVMGIAAVAGSIAVRHILWSTLLAACLCPHWVPIFGKRQAAALHSGVFPCHC